ncbi:hypothetical protein BS78_05G071300 [Paspalum vaginatum]|nr:hypothetical protein BS78_05G071300 [Paspalum vaginatum]
MSCSSSTSAQLGAKLLRRRIAPPAGPPLPCRPWSLDLAHLLAAGSHLDLLMAMRPSSPHRLPSQNSPWAWPLCAACRPITTCSSAGCRFLMHVTTNFFITCGTHVHFY